MKKKFFSIALIAMSLVAFNGMAQTTNKQDNTVKTENVRSGKSDKKGERPQRNPYEGLNLTDAQKTNLQELDNKRREARKQQAQAREENKTQDKAARMEARKAEKKQYLQEVKAIIGQDKYVVFLENMFTNNGGGGKHGGKEMREGKRGDKQNFSHNKGGKSDRKKDGKKDGKKGREQRGDNMRPDRSQS